MTTRCSNLKNKRGRTLDERLNEDIEYLDYIEDMEQRTALAYKALGAVDFAVEFGLIRPEDWEHHIHKIFSSL